MESDNSTEFGEISERITEDRGALLTVLSRSKEDSLSTTELRRQTGIASGSMNYHMQTLADLGLVEVVGQTESSGQIPANVYALTDRGQSFLDSKCWQSFPRMEYVRGLEQRIDELEQGMQDMQDKHDELIKRVQKIVSQS